MAFLFLSLSSRRLIAALWLALGVQVGAQPVTLSFRLAPDSREPLARDVWAEVQTPAGRTWHLPAFPEGDRFLVRVRPEGAGVYELRGLSERNEGGAAVSLAPAEVLVPRVDHPGRPARPSVRRAANRPRHFELSTGEAFTPIGSNLPWPSRGRKDYYRQGIPAFGAVGLNWMRIWMAHWSGLNLDWLPATLGPSPLPGAIDERVAAQWDELLALAEDAGVYLQIVLQHHGQYSTTVNPNWDENPWNAAKPHGFLATASEFFTSERARAFTKRKYRLIVARYGWSPAVMAWELFNEVHWVDALKNDHDVPAVARWHDEMAAYIRSIDAYEHLVTTSTDDLRSPFYASMDFYQPHLYPSNILAAIRTYHVPFASLDRPIFYGEFGDDHQPLTPAEKKAHHAIVPPVWASLMGIGELPAQVWLGWDLLDNGRIRELGAVASFLRATKIAARGNLAPFSPAVESRRHRVPLRVQPSQVWQRREPTDTFLPLDGTQPLELADIPRHLDRPRTPEAGHVPSRTTFRLDYPRPAKLAARFAHGGDAGSTVRLRLGDRLLGEHSWAPRDPSPDAPKRPAEIAFELPAGAHRVTVENLGPAPVEIDHLDLGVDTAALAAIGKRSPEFVAVWLWHRTDIFAVNAPSPVTGTLVLDEVPAGTWSIRWWDTLGGRAGRPRAIRHAGGALRLPTPRVTRHAAVVLERVAER